MTKCGFLLLLFDSLFSWIVNSDSSVLGFLMLLHRSSLLFFLFRSVFLLLLSEHRSHSSLLNNRLWLLLSNWLLLLLLYLLFSFLVFLELSLEVIAELWEVALVADMLWLLIGWFITTSKFNVRSSLLLLLSSLLLLLLLGLSVLPGTTAHSFPFEIALLLCILGCSFVANNLLDVLDFSNSHINTGLSFLIVRWLVLVVAILWCLLLFLYKLR